jgi:hypothetical protein
MAEGDAMTGDEVRQVFEAMLPQEEIDRFCRKFPFWRQNPKIGYRKFNSLQTPKRSKKHICDRTAPDPYGVRSRADEKRAKVCRTRVLGSNGTSNWRQPKRTARTYGHFCKKHVNAVKWTPQPSQKSPANVRTYAEVFARPWFLMH